VSAQDGGDDLRRAGVSLSTKATSRPVYFGSSLEVRICSSRTFGFFTVKSTLPFGAKRLQTSAACRTRFPRVSRASRAPARGVSSGEILKRGVKLREVRGVERSNANVANGIPDHLGLERTGLTSMGAGGGSSEAPGASRSISP
jgi:hypothetical protein